jgi:hypothetical protein
MHEQATRPVRITHPLLVEEVEIDAGNPDRRYIIRREPHPEMPGEWITEAIRDEVRMGPGYGDIHTRRAVEWIEDDGRPLEQIAREWAERRGLGPAA